MFRRELFVSSAFKKTTVCFSTTAQTNFKVVVAGASGGIGQPLALLMKMNPLVTHVALYDVAKVTPGVAKDLSHMNTKCKATGHVGPDQLCSALKGADLVLIPAGVPRKPGMTRDDLFNTNATIVRNFGYGVATACPCAVCAIITNPVNSVVPIFAEAMKKMGSHDPARVLGVTTLDVVRSATFVGEINGVDPATVNVPCIGGHAGTTIIPLLSQSNPPLKLEDKDKIKVLTKRIQEAGTEVVKAKAGGGSATLSMAFAAARLANAILRGLKGECDVVECAYVESCVTEAKFFSNPLVFGTTGVVKNLGYGKLNEMEQEMLKAAVPQLQKNIAKGIAFMEKPC